MRDLLNFDRDELIVQDDSSGDEEEKELEMGEKFNN